MFRLARTVSLAILATGLLAAAVPADDADPEFDKLVSPAEVRAALVKFDPSDLGAVAAKTAAAERQLGRTRPGVSAADFYEAALRVAAERKDAAAVAKLAADPHVTADADLAKRLRAVQLGLKASRGGDPELSVALDQVTPDQFAAFRGFLTRINDAKAIADRDELDALRDQVGEASAINKAQRAYLVKRIDTARKSLPEKPTRAVAAVKAARAQAVKEKKAEPKTDEKPDEKKLDEKKPADPPAAGGSIVAKLTGDAAALSDEAFEDKIDLTKVGRAWNRGDAATLADYAFKMADAERVLNRPHKHVPAKLLFQAAFGLAVAAGDTDTVARIEKGLKEEKGPNFEGKAEFLAKLTGSQKLIVASRAGRRPFQASVEQTSPASFAAFRTYLDRIQVARVQRNAAELTALVEGMDTVIELDDAQRAYLRERAAEAKAAGPGRADVVGPLALLGGADIGAGLPPANRAVLDFCRANLGKSVGTGEPAALVAKAVEKAGAAGRTEVKRPADAKPGDVIELRDVTLAAANPDGTIRELKYATHTAVIGSVEAPGRFTLLHQGVGPASESREVKAVVQVGYLDLSSVKAGTVTFWRPTGR